MTITFPWGPRVTRTSGRIAGAKTVDLNRWKQVTCLVLTVAAIAACRAEAPASSPDGGADGACGPGLAAVGSACVPLFDECGDEEISLLGGGCKRVGVRECPGGLAGPPDWKCRRIGVEECTPDAGGRGLRGPPDWTCKPIGPPTTCPQGWTKVKGGWCEPILPGGKCPDGKMELLGKSSCQPVGDCGSGKWGQIKTTSAFVFVDAGYRGKDSNGSQDKPFTTIGAGLAAGKKIAVAAGSYKEDVVIKSAYTELAGRCPQLVTIVGQWKTGAALTVGAGPAKVSGVTVTGPGRGIDVKGDKVTLEELAVRSCQGTGVRVFRGSVTITDALIAGNTRVGLSLLDGSTARLERCAIRDTRADQTSQEVGAGILSRGSELELKSCLVSDSASRGISQLDGVATVEGSVVRRTTEGHKAAFGQAIYTSRSSPSPGRSRLVVRDSLLGGNHGGVWLEWDAEATLERTVIRDTRVAAGAQQWGGAAVVVNSARAPAVQLTMRRCLVTGSVPSASNLAAVTAANYGRVTLERTVIENTSSAERSSGMGIIATGDATLVLRDGLVAGSTAAGIDLHGGGATIERLVVRDTRADPKSGLLGAGILARIWREGTPKKPVLTLGDSLVIDNAAGVWLWGADAKIQRIVVRHSGSRALEGTFGFYVGDDQLETKIASTLTMRDGLIADNYGAGIVVANSDATIERTVVRDTRPMDTVAFLGYGLVCGSTTHKRGVTVRDGLFAGNHGTAIQVEGGRITVERSVVRDTGAVGQDCLGWGLVSKSFGKLPAAAKVSETVFARNPSGGVVLWGGRGELRRVMVRGDRRRRCKTFNSGFGVIAVNESESGAANPSSLTLEESRISESGRTGVAVEGSSASVRSCEVRQTLGDDAGFGDGVEVSVQSSLQLVDSLVSRSRRTGLIVAKDGKGSVRRSVFARNTFGIYVDSNASFSVGDDNGFIDNQEREVAFGSNLKSAPLPGSVPSYFK